jgi:hypothetical protein
MDLQDIFGFFLSNFHLSSFIFQLSNFPTFQLSDFQTFHFPTFHFPTFHFPTFIKIPKNLSYNLGCNGNPAGFGMKHFARRLLRQFAFGLCATKTGNALIENA